nr:hypothetical protein [Tanacetum cinerariifolium]
QNGVAERRNRTLIEAARTMLADAKLPVTFWAEAVNTACYVRNRVLVNNSQNKTPYELFNVDSDGVEADVSNMETTITASPTPTLKIYKDHPKSQIIGPMDTPIQTRNKSKEMEEQSFIAIIHQKTNPALLQFYLFSCFLSQVEPKKISDALQDPSWDPEFPARVYKMDKAMYGLHQAPRAWYGTLSKYLLTNGFQRGTIDQTLFIKRQRGNFILVQVYMHDIIFGSSNPQLCREFKALMHEKFQMSAMGDILKKFGYLVVRYTNTPMDKENPWGKDAIRKDVDLHLYRSMIGSLMYLAASRPDIMFVVCACARHQVTPKECHLHTVKMIFRYLKGHPKLGLWYPKESPFDLVAYSDSNYGGATQDCKSTTGGCQFLCRRLILWVGLLLIIEVQFLPLGIFPTARPKFSNCWISIPLVDLPQFHIRNTKSKDLCKKMAQPDNNTQLSSAFKTFFERETLTGVNFNDWSLNKDFGYFVRNFNMHCVGKTVTELHALLFDYVKGLKDKAPTPQGFKEERKLSYGEQYLQVGNGAQAAVEAIGVLDLVLPSV